MLPITLFLAANVLGPNVDIFFEKAEKYRVDPTVMAAVIDCESGGNQNARHVNTNGSIDRGLGQVNSSHNAEAASRGDDLDTVDGNLDFAFYLVSKEGFRPYSASINCAAEKINKAGADTS